MLKKIDYLIDYSLRYSFFFRKSWFDRSCKIVLNVLITSRFNKMIIRFVFLFYTMCIFFVKNFNIDLINLFLQHFMWKSSNNWCVFVNYVISLLWLILWFCSLLLIYTRCNIILRRLMRKILHILQKEKFSKRRKILLF